MAKPTLPSLVIKSTTSWRVEKISKRRDIYPELVCTIATVRASATGVPQHTGVRFINQITIISTYYYCPPVGVRSIVINPSVCASVCLSRAYLWNRWTDLHDFFCADPLWPWLGPPLAALRYVMYFCFLDDVTFNRNGPYGDAWAAEPWSTTASGVWCLWMPC